MHFPIKYYLPHLIFFGVYLAALVPVLYYYHRRHPHPRFRAGIGEMTLIAVIALLIGGSASYALGNLFRGDQKFGLDAAYDHGAGWSKDTNAPQEKSEDNYRKE